MLVKRARREGRLAEKSFEKVCFMVGAGGMFVFTALMVTLWFTITTPAFYP